ncbi:MAG: type II/IV secretion system protein [Candidatus Magasanikbacteria bacterium]|jgi:type IV pilus assembly protein PilB|nr:type II/IV secretion system protein [Candidatus Magasanikbacteria bacterium]MBT5262629.1 type II/IV secretion system protein [Candidatus Magasanikbacteria bacterium]MBT5820230.1 type II/IV secretion system protein [Candidatus Magasanikbacteria bacterium]MBT6294555.1 type II/IV secretion system protein [Candidatus Magasanikbacteria bacterium]
MNINDDLLKAQDNAQDNKEGVVPKLHIATKNTQANFQKKMAEVALKDKEKQAKVFAQSIGVPHIDLSKFPVSQNALRQLAEKEARNLNAVCFFANQEEVRIGALDPSKEEVKELLYQIEERSHAKGGLYTISQKSLDYVLNLYKTLPIVAPISKDVAIKAKDLETVQEAVKDFASFQELISNVSTTTLVAYIMGAGLKLGASDIHIEAEKEGIALRFRLDGILHDAATLDSKKFGALVGRLKLLGSLKINITDNPQDGRFAVKIPDGEIDIRLSTIPTIYGESVVMRILKSTATSLSFEGLGLRGAAFEKLKQEVERPNGMIVTTGPTGSGKTTTLYAILNKLNTEETKIITLEDPVEYKLAGVNQSQIDRSKEYTFAGGLRSILRQDPDIVMVGELRDFETADVAINAALTGHLVVSTIHTNSAAGAIPRFLAMGVKPFLLAPSLNAIIGQRLVRRICESCKAETEVDDQTKQKITDILSKIPESSGEKVVDISSVTFYKGKGCEVCNNIGYKGRLGIYEILIMSKEIESRILGGQVSEYDMQDIAISQGMVTMVQDGLLKVVDGITTVEEVFRVSE